MVEQRDSHVLDDGAVADRSSELPRRAQSPEFGAIQSAILASAKLSVMATDADGIIRLFNVGAERMLGYAAFEVVNLITPADLHDPQELRMRARAVNRELSTTIAPDFEALTCKASLGVEDCYDSTLIRKNRERIRVAIAITGVCDDKGCIVGYSLILTEISVREQLAKPDLLTRLSHEMRTPLSAILGFAQLMESGSPSPTDSQRKSITRILQAGWHLEKLIDMTRDLADIDSRTLSLSLESVPLAAVMLECRDMIDSQAEERGVRVIFPLLEIPCSVSADRSRLQEVLGHLLSAAIEYSDVLEAIVVDWEIHGVDWIRINIHGGGPGLERLTGFFGHSDDLEPNVNTADGTSLRLAQRLVELMGGAIRVKSNDATRKVLFFELKRMLPGQADEFLGPLDVDFHASATSVANNIEGQMT